MEKHTLRIKDGKVTITVEGVKGSACQEATAKIEAALGKVTRTTPTGEMFQTEQTVATDNL